MTSSRKNFETFLQADAQNSQLSYPDSQVDGVGMVENKIFIQSPLAGKVIQIKCVPDPDFSEEILGDSIAIHPTIGEVKAPFDGVVTTVFQTGRSIGLTSKDGVKILIHIGIDTVRLNGEGYTPYVRQGDQVKAGDLLVAFDLHGFEKAGYSMITPVIVTNTQTYKNIIPTIMDRLDFFQTALTIETL